MSDHKQRIRMLLASIVFIAVVGMFVGVWVVWYKPFSERVAEEEAQKAHDELIEATSSQSHFEHELVIRIDGFSGYSPYRDPIFKNYLNSNKIKLTLLDDGANYGDRIQSLDSAESQLAVYTIDALLTSSAEIGDLPGTIIMIGDVSVGADAAVANKTTFPNIDAFNDPNVKFVCVQNSPSETLARVIIQQFNLPNMSKNPFMFVDSPDDVYKIYRTSKPTDKYVFITWEPFVARMMDNPDYHVIMDSSKARNAIVDVLVGQRSFIHKNPELAEAVLKAYFTTIFRRSTDMHQLVLEDSVKIGEPLREEQAEKLAQTIMWKNTQENFAHFGLTSGHSLQHVEEMIFNITQTLEATDAFHDYPDPTGGAANKLYYDGILRRLQSQQWHPGFSQESVRSEQTLAVLSDAQWNNLRPIGTLNVPRLVFARGTDRLSNRSEATLQSLVEQLKQWPQYYLVVRGNSAKDSDPEIQRLNSELARKRADAATQWLVDHGVDKNRIRAESGTPNGSTTVAFVLGEVPY